MGTRYCIRNVKVVAPDSSLSGKKVDMLIEDGILKEIGQVVGSKDAVEYDLDGACVSIGWLDVGTQVGDPGYEHKEDLNTVSLAAKAGGFTGLASYPNTHPVVHSKSEVLYVRNKTGVNLVDFFPVGAVSQDCEGKEITEMYDMRAAGAVAFSDGKKSIQDSGMMMRGLLYVKPFNGVIINHPFNEAVAQGGIVHEGETSTTLGLKGIPRLAEELMVARDLYLSEYTDSRLHLANISCARSVELIREAKQKGFKVTTSVNPMNLVFEDKHLLEFDTNLKVLPPLREACDKEALVEGLEEGVIDIISSNHIPHDSESKELEFLYADYGVLGLETTYAVINTNFGEILSQEQIIEKLGVNPRKMLGLSIPSIEEQAEANLTFFRPDFEWEFSKDDIHSKSRNTPFVGEKFKGKVIGVCNNGLLEIFE